MKVARVVLGCLPLLACSTAPAPVASTAETPTSGAAADPAPPSSSATGPEAGGFPAPEPGTCTACFAFDGDALALRALVQQERPRVIGFGEAHTPAGFEARSTVRRFTEDLLPELAPQSGLLLVELLAPPVGCEQARAAVKEEADAITTGQAGTNQDEYLQLGKSARKLGILPDVLRASCADLQAIQEAGELGVVVMMETIARLTARAVRERSEQLSPNRPLVLAYGGALHNDLVPRQGRETWSYGPELSAHAPYLELDLVLPDLVRDSPSWQSFAWYEAYRTIADKREKTWLIQVRPGSWVLVLGPDPRPSASARGSEQPLQEP